MFQSKINWSNDSNLIKEAIKLTTWREASFILNYTSNEFEAIDIDSVIESRGVRNDKITAIPLDKYIGENFLNCLIGDLDLKYDASYRRLIWRTNSGQIVGTKFSIPHKIAVSIKAPNINYGRNLQYDKEIENNEIHNFRMDASENDILSLDDNYSINDLKKARAKKVLIYHSDTFNFGDKLLDELMNRRMQEVNVAHDILKGKIKK